MRGNLSNDLLIEAVLEQLMEEKSLGLWNPKINDEDGFFKRSNKLTKYRIRMNKFVNREQLSFPTSNEKDDEINQIFDKIEEHSSLSSRGVYYEGIPVAVELLDMEERTLFGIGIVILFDPTEHGGSKLLSQNQYARELFHRNLIGSRDDGLAWAISTTLTNQIIRIVSLYKNYHDTNKNLATFVELSDVLGE